MRTLLLGLGLSAGPAGAAESAAAPAERPDASMVHPAPAGDGAAGRPRNAAKKAGGNKGRDATARASALKKGNATAAKRSGGTETSVPDDTAPAADPQSVALRGVRG